MKILFLITGPPMATPNWFSRSSPFLWCCLTSFEIVGGIQFVVAEKFPTGAVPCVRAGLDRGIQNRSARTAELGAEVCGLHPEFLNRVDWGQDDKVRAVQEVDRVGVVVDAIEQVVVLRRTEAVRCKGA